MTPEQLELLKEISNLLSIDSEPKAVHAVYISPAQQLRNAADEMERKEALIRRFRKELYFWENGEYLKEPEVITISSDLTIGDGTVSFDGGTVISN